MSSSSSESVIDDRIRDATCVTFSDHITSKPDGHDTYLMKKIDAILSKSIEFETRQPSDITSDHSIDVIDEIQLFRNSSKIRQKDLEVIDDHQNSNRHRVRYPKNYPVDYKSRAQRVVVDYEQITNDCNLQYYRNRWKSSITICKNCQIISHVRQ